LIDVEARWRLIVEYATGWSMVLVVLIEASNTKEWSIALRVLHVNGSEAYLYVHI